MMRIIDYVLNKLKKNSLIQQILILSLREKENEDWQKNQPMVFLSHLFILVY